MGRFSDPNVVKSGRILLFGEGTSCLLGARIGEFTARVRAWPNPDRKPGFQRLNDQR
jgi:hypothetical protein